MNKTYIPIEAKTGSNHDLYMVLYGWDVDSILIMNPQIIITTGKDETK